MASNLPPGVTDAMVDGKCAEWEVAEGWALEQLLNLKDVDEVYRAINIGIAAVQTERPDIEKLLRDARADERMAMQSKRARQRGQ
jgi:hypothetical protein